MNMTKLNVTVIVLISVVLTGFSAHSVKAQKDVLDIKAIEKSLAKTTDSLYAGKFEVSNYLYKLFERDLKAANRTDDLAISKVDSANWLDKLAYNAPYMDYYYNHPAYKEYPVVNISYEGAVLFCDWLTTKYNSCPNRKFKKVVFRLPTNKEWTYAARCNYTNIAYPWGARLMKDGEIMCNYLRFGDERITFRKDLNIYEIVKNPSEDNAFEISDKADITAPVKSYKPNDFGLYNVCGNVAEMTIEKGKTRGGSYKNSGWDVRIDAVDDYTKSATDIGFRYFMQVLEK